MNAPLPETPSFPPRCPRSIICALLGYLLVAVGSALVTLAHRDPLYLFVVVGYGILVLILMVRVCFARRAAWADEFDIHDVDFHGNRHRRSRRPAGDDPDAKYGVAISAQAPRPNLDDGMMPKPMSVVETSPANTLSP